MSFRNAFGIYHVLERILKASPKPLTSVELFDSPDVRQFAEDVNQVSDYLGHMYRRDYLSRVPSRGIGQARYAYTWKHPKLGSRVDTPVQRKAQPKLVLRTENGNAERLAEMAKMQQPLQVVPHVDVKREGNQVHIHIVVEVK